jgi:stress response protein YsnF
MSDSQIQLNKQSHKNIKLILERLTLNNEQTKTLKTKFVNNDFSE